MKLIFDQTPWEEQLGRIVLDTARRQTWSTILVGGCCKASHSDLKKLVGFVNASGKVAASGS